MKMKKSERNQLKKVADDLLYSDWVKKALDKAQTVEEATRIMITARKENSNFLEGQKIVIIINGKGGSGKDTICDILNKHYPVTSISTITKVKQAARLIFGWDGRTKSDADRKFLADLKDLWTNYNDGPFKYAYEEYKKFRDKPAKAYNEIMVIHVREPEEIEKLCNAINDIPCKTLLITFERTNDHGYGNHADDNVETYAYNCVYHNDGPLENLDQSFMWFFHTVIAPSWQESH